MSSGPRILIIDIETLPPTVYSWTIHNAFISIDQIIHPGGILGLGYKWHDEKSAHWIAGEELFAKTWELLDAADVVVGYNSDGFDLKHLNREMFLAGMAPPSPYKKVDLWKESKKNFKFLSGKLDFIVQQAGLGKKDSTGGFQLWIDCIHGDEKAWRKMSRYCMKDVRITDRLFDRMLPWLGSMPNVNLYNPDASGHTCPRCGSTSVQKQGTRVALSMTYQRYQCQACGSWSHDVKGERVGGELRSA